MNEITQTTDIVAEATRYLDAMGLSNSLKPAQKTQFLEICSAYQLNPFKREIYGIRYGENFNIIVGYEVYLKRAERSGLLDGWKKSTTGSTQEGSLASTITIYRKDWKYPLEHTAYLAEFNGQSPLWKKMPRFMLEKVATAQAFRLAFPDELGGMPYIKEEQSLIAGSDLPEPPKVDINELADRVRGLWLCKAMTDNKKQEYKELFDAALEQGDTYGMGDMIKHLEKLPELVTEHHATPKPIEEMTPDEIDAAIEKGLQSEYPVDIARNAALAKYEDKAVLLKHLRERRTKRLAKQAAKQEAV